MEPFNLLFRDPEDEFPRLKVEFRILEGESLDAFFEGEEPMRKCLEGEELVVAKIFLVGELLLSVVPLRIISSSAKRFRTRGC